MAKKNKRSNIFKGSNQDLRLNSRVNFAMREFQNQEHNTQKEALGPNTKR